MKKMNKLLFCVMFFSFSLMLNIAFADDITNGLIAWYPFDGNANDGSSFNNHAIPVGAKLVEDRFGNSNSAYFFDGSNDYIDLPHSNLNLYNVPSYSHSLWINLKEIKAINGLISAHNGKGNYWHGLSCTVEGKLYLVMQNYNENKWFYWVTLSSCITANEWAHIVLTWKQGGNISEDVNIYVNGIHNQLENKIFYGTYDKSYIPKYVPNDPVGSAFGRKNEDNPRHYLYGTLDDIRIYNREISFNEVQQLYNEKAAVTGCINLKNNPIQTGKAMLMQSGEIFQSTSLDKNGCYKFYHVDEDKPFGVMIRRIIE